MLKPGTQSYFSRMQRWPNAAGNVMAQADAPHRILAEMLEEAGS